MTKPKLIIVEGPQGAGKTSVTNWLRENIKFSNLYRLTGHNNQSNYGIVKTKKMYNGLMTYMRSLADSEANINMIFDRIFISEYVYCTIGLRGYVFPLMQYIEKLSRLSDVYDIHIINLYISDLDEYERRFNRDKCNLDYAKFSKESSVKQQIAYRDAMDMIYQMYGEVIKVTHIDTIAGIEVFDELRELFEI